MSLHALLTDLAAARRQNISSIFAEPRINRHGGLQVSGSRSRVSHPSVDEYLVDTVRVENLLSALCHWLMAHVSFIKIARLKV